MSDVSTLDAVVNATLTAHETPAPVEPEEPEPDAETAEEPDEGQEEKQLNKLLRKAETAFAKGNKGLLLSRVECGKWVHEVYVYRLQQGHKDRSFTSQLIFNRLAVHADSKQDCDASNLAGLYKTVELLADGDNWKSQSLGKLSDLCSLVTRTEGTELYGVFDASKAEQAKGLFTWACGDGLKRPSRDDIRDRVFQLVNPEKYAEKQAEKQRKASESASAAEDTSAAADGEADDTVTSPAAVDNLIGTEARPDKPDWKDVPDGMAALFQEGCKQQPGKSADMMRDFAKQFVWTAAMAKGLVAGIAESKDAEQAEAIFQDIVDSIADEYSIYPAGEAEEEESDNGQLVHA